MVSRQVLCVLIEGILNDEVRSLPNIAPSSCLILYGLLQSIDPPIPKYGYISSIKSQAKFVVEISIDQSACSNLCYTFLSTWHIQLHVLNSQSDPVHKLGLRSPTAMRQHSCVSQCLISGENHTRDQPNYSPWLNQDSHL